MTKNDACKGCFGYCCVCYDSVMTTEEDRERIAKHFGMSVEHFTLHFTNPGFYGTGLRPIKYGGRPCMFFRQGRCGIYSVRPDWCRKYGPRTDYAPISCRDWHKAKAEAKWGI